MRLRESRPLRLVLSALFAIVIAIGAYFGWSAWQHQQRLRAPIPAALFDIAPIRLAQPDAIIVSTRLRDLPHDLLSVPLLHAALTEDFVFYYQENDTLLGLKGTLRRIAYEHQLSIGDEAIALALDQPADLALWHGADGKLTHWLLNANRNEWTKLLQVAAQVAASDKQLSQVGTLPLSTGGTTPLYKLNYTPRDSLFFAGDGDKMVVFSDPSMITGASYGDAANRDKVWEALLDSHWQISPLRRHFGLEAFAGKHTMVAQTAYLSFNYQQFFPALEALRFDFDGQQWASYARLNAGTPHDAFTTTGLWAHVPVSASLCAAMPLDTQRLAPILAASNDTAALADPKSIEGLHAPVAICWYPDGGLYSPLVVARVDSHTTDAALDSLFDASIGNHRAAPDDSDAAKGATTPASQVSTQNGARVWHRQVATDFGRFDVTMARQNDWLVFSPRAKLVENTLAVFASKRPALADSLPSGRDMIEAVINPRTLSALLLDATLNSLPQKSEPILREAAQNRLAPRLKAMAAFPPVALILPQPLHDTERAWQPIEWQTLKDGQ
jgi:uncharacterized protein YfaA (DUF2138 family)